MIDISNGTRMLMMMLIFVLPVSIMISIYVLRDCKNRRMKSLQWTLIASLTPCLIGFVLYLLVRSKYSNRVCPLCGAVISQKHCTCPGCGAKVKHICDQCANPIEIHWKVCPQCTAQLPEKMDDLIIPIQPKDNTFWIIVAVTTLVPVILMLFVGTHIFAEMEPRYFLSRYTAEGTVNTGFVDLENIRQESWHTMERVSFAKGVETHCVTVEKYQNSYVVITNDADGEIQRVSLDSISGGGLSHEIKGTSAPYDMETEYGEDGERICEGHYFRDDTGRLLELRIYTEGNQTDKSTELYRIYFTHGENGNLIQQQLVTPQGKKENLTYSYEEGKLVRADEWDAEGELQRYTVFTYTLSNTVRTAGLYNPEGILQEVIVTSYDTDGNVLQEEVYDASMELISSTSFDYDPISFMLRPSNLSMLTLTWLCLLVLTGYMVITGNKESEL